MATTLTDELGEELRSLRSARQRGENRRRVRRQAADLLRLQRDAEERELLVGRMRARRGGERADFQIEAVGDAKRVIVASELLVARADLPLARPVLDRLGGFTEAGAPCAELDGRLVVLHHGALGGRGLEAVARQLRTRLSVRASVDHIVPLGPVDKGLGGPEPVDLEPGHLPAPGSATEGAPVVAVIDSGIAAEERKDRWLDDVERRPDNVDLLDVYPVGGPDGYLDLAAGHGTFAAGVVRQVAPTAEIVAYRAMDSDGVGREVDIACTMIRAVRDGAQILNLSLGTQTDGDDVPLAFAEALEVIRALPGGEDVLVVAAAGNFADERRCWPAAFAGPGNRQVVAVAALGEDGTGAPWSSRGSWVTCSTLGEGVISTYVEGTERDVSTDPPHDDVYGEDAWALWSGTSFAAPQIAGAVARTWRQGAETPRQAFDRLLTGAASLHSSGFGWGVKVL